MAESEKKAGVYKDYLSKLATYNLCVKHKCNKEQTAEYDKMTDNLPQNVIRVQYDAEVVYYTVNPDEGMTHEQRMEYLAILQTEKLKKIVGMLTFFTVLTIIGLIGGLILNLALN